MTAEGVVKVLGRNYKLIDTIGKSAVPGQDYGLTYSTNDGEIELIFTYGKVTYVSGYHLTLPNGLGLAKGDPVTKMQKVLGSPKDAGGPENARSYKYLWGKISLIVSTCEGAVEDFSLE